MTCTKCNVDELEKLVSCGRCNNRTCHDCTGLTPTEIRCVLLKKRTLIYECGDCREATADISPDKSKHDQQDRDQQMESLKAEVALLGKLVKDQTDKYSNLMKNNTKSKEASTVEAENKLLKELIAEMQKNSATLQENNMFLRKLLEKESQENSKNGKAMPTHGQEMGGKKADQRSKASELAPEGQCNHSEDYKQYTTIGSGLEAHHSDQSRKNNGKQQGDKQSRERHQRKRVSGPETNSISLKQVQEACRNAQNAANSVNKPNNVPEQLLTYTSVLGEKDSQKPQVESDWKTVTRRKRNTLQIVGNRPTTDGTLRSAPKKAFLHVSRLHPDTTAEHLEEFLKQTFPEVTIEATTSKFPQYYTSFKVTIDLPHLETALNDNIWPYGTYVTRFFHRKSVTRDPK